MKFLNFLWAVPLLMSLSLAVRAELQDQGLNSIMGIIDQALTRISPEGDGEVEPNQPDLQNAIDTIINLSRTLGNLSYSRLQCGEAAVLAEFTQRVQMMPEAQRDPMRDAFQEGFDKSKEETELLSQDECERLTRSRNRSEQGTEANVREDPDAREADEPVEQVVEEFVEEEDPKFRHLRIAELSGQLAYKRKFCDDDKIFNRDYNQYLESIPVEYRDEVKDAYWKGYQRGKKLNKGLTKANC